MQLVVTLCACLLVLFALGLGGALRIELESRAIGEPSGEWAIAAAFALLGFTLSVVRTSKAPARWQLRFGSRTFTVPRFAAKRKPQPKKPAEEATREHTADPAKSWLPQQHTLDLAQRVLSRWAIEALDLELSYGFRDIALTGRISAALYVLAGVVPQPIVVRQSPNWDGDERFELAAAGAVSLQPALVLYDLLWYKLKRTQPAKRALSTDGA